MIDAGVADVALRALEVDEAGLDALDHRYLTCIAGTYEGGPVGIETLAAALSEPRDALEEIVEPYLLQQGFIGRTPRGRVLTLKAFRHLGLSGPPKAASPELPMFEEGKTRPGHGRLLGAVKCLMFCLVRELVSGNLAGGLSRPRVAARAYSLSGRSRIVIF